MKLRLLFFASVTVWTARADWTAVTHLLPNQKLEIATTDGGKMRAAFVSASSEAVVVRDASGERSLGKASVRRIKAADPSRRLRNGLLGIGIGAGAGAVVGAVVCPSCPNEGHGYKYVGPGIALGAAIGALAFLPMPYRTIYTGP